MFYISKSKYCSYIDCPKKFWLNKYKPEVKKEDPAAKQRFENGNLVGDLAMGLFGNFVEVTTFNEDGTLNLSKMIEKTKEEINKGTNVICEASFSYKGQYCAVDLLKKENDGYAIYEVKSSTTYAKKPAIKDIYAADIAYQKNVLECCGIHVVGTYLVTLSKDYRHKDSLELSTLFNVIDANDAITKHYENVEMNLKAAQTIIESDKEPEISFHKNCKDCDYRDYCMRDIPSPSVFDLYIPRGQSFSSLISLYEDGIVSFEDYKNSEKWNECHIIRKIQVEHYLNELGTYINKEIINDFLNKLSYPLYFLDFETMNPALPEYEGTAPYQQIPFQYSLHYINNEGGELLHKEYLSESGIDPRRGVAEALCRDIQKDACIIVYNETFERTVLKNLAEYFPDLSDHLSNIRDHIVDLYEPFSKGGCYNKAMGKSFSIKSVLPALYPDDPACDYHNLDGVQNGGDAMTIFPKLKDMSAEEQEKNRKALLKYCELDTLATVKVLEKLQELVK